MAALVTLPALLSLYRIDRDAQTLQTALANVQKNQRVQQGKISQTTQQFDGLDSTNKKLQTDVGMRELELKTRQAHIEKMRASLNTTKTNKEYSAILVQISADKAEVAKMESGLLEEMQEVENNNKKLAELKAQLDGEKGALAKLQAEQGARVADLQGQINQLLMKRKEAVRGVPAAALVEYDRVSRKYPGDALAALEYDENDLESITCGGCYMGLNVEKLNALRSRDEIRKCDSCGRILYLPELMSAEQRQQHESQANR